MRCDAVEVGSDEFSTDSIFDKILQRGELGISFARVLLSLHHIAECLALVGDQMTFAAS